MGLTIPCHNKVLHGFIMPLWGLQYHVTTNYNIPTLRLAPKVHSISLASHVFVNSIEREWEGRASLLEKKETTCKTYEK
jgi:hypothetical protein